MAWAALEIPVSPAPITAILPFGFLGYSGPGGGGFHGVSLECLGSSVYTHRFEEPYDHILDQKVVEV